MENIDEQVVQLLQDDRLVKWVLSPDEAINAYWVQWMKDNPGSLTALFRARGIVHDLAYVERPENVQEMADSIWSGIESAVAAPSGTPVVPPHPARVRRISLAVWLAAAAFTGIIVLAGRFFRQESGTHPVAPEQKVANLLVRQDLDRVNQTDRSQEVYLVDGSRVTLQPGAGIRYAAFLQKDKREVYLRGDAFFEIAKDARRPFYVYSGDLVVQVLGTSFSVNTNQSNNEIQILVRTGKIAVSTRSSLTTVAQKPLILVQDQKLVYKKQHADWIPMAISSQDLAAAKPPVAKAIDFNFEETPVVNIFQTLENAYGIPIHYDEKTFSHCIITTELTNETFEEKLKIICAAIGADYRIDEEGVFVDGKPCK